MIYIGVDLKKCTVTALSEGFDLLDTYQYSPYTEPDFTSWLPSVMLTTGEQAEWFFSEKEAKYQKNLSLFSNHLIGTHTYFLVVDRPLMNIFHFVLDMHINKNWYHSYEFCDKSYFLAAVRRFIDRSYIIPCLVGESEQLLFWK